jgi:hypothetical protein
MAATRGLRQACQDLAEAKGHGLPIGGSGSIRRCADGWLPRVRHDFMLQDLMLEALPLC